MGVYEYGKEELHAGRYGARAKTRELLHESNLSSPEDIPNLFKETGLNAELDEELGYSKYDYRKRRRTTAGMDTAASG